MPTTSLVLARLGVFFAGRKERRAGVRGLANSTVVLVARWWVGWISTVLRPAQCWKHLPAGTMCTRCLDLLKALRFLGLFFPDSYRFGKVSCGG